ncbi:hypothetical protein DDB_G0275879 [Dictyostelium discoideum AX4]|uniref:Probable serine/threonine-protein kinase fnkE n=1 Tax=Dictyostelium discoideum TaxID=44689 RepID=FNKE_DICDI|nr:hypothetical protein DDB_G0275879 [Dictyostelium discoideum AX4]Q552Z2.1 RecName: Full=Probable serine/threonine-protein kinase fnkE; AltName: Full=FNIP repeat-containing protein E [Dictyostelium discoideum]EAL69690.1 hypothetical protein DDB_G0275879 [Dictyostelium discoideum AX4]|eukprot:XP_643528.1 hypothetical protein DDB_G0275879 [Dictyostelium discoideum AX4]
MQKIKEGYRRRHDYIIPKFISFQSGYLDFSFYQVSLKNVKYLDLSSYYQLHAPRRFRKIVEYLNLSYGQLLTLGTLPKYVMSLDLSSYNQLFTPGRLPIRVSLDLSSYNQLFTPGRLPDTVDYLKLSSYNQLFTPGTLPNHMVYLNLSSYNQPLTPGTLPNKVKYLVLSSYNQLLTPGTLPNNVKYVDLSSYNKLLTPETLPNKVKYLVLSSYDQLLTPGTLPNNVKCVDLSSYDKLLTPGTLPNNVKYVDLSSYNKLLTPRTLPNNVECLVLSSYNQLLTPGILPNYVKYLDISSYNQLLTPGTLSNNVEYLDLSSYNQVLAPKTIPNNVKCLDCPSYKQSLISETFPNRVGDLELSDHPKHVNDNWEIIKPQKNISENKVYYTTKHKNAKIIDVLNICKCSLKLYGYVKDRNNEFNIYFEYIDKAIPLSRLLEKLNKKEQFIVATEIIKSIKSIHEMGIIHFDIKCQNILILYDENEKMLPTDFIKIIGFDHSTLDSEVNSNIIGVTETHMAPEIKLKNGKLGYKSDIWSLGCTLIEIVGGNLKLLDINGIPLIPDHLSNLFKNTIQHCLQINPNARFNANELYNYVIKDSIMEPIEPIYLPNQCTNLPLFNEVIVPSGFFGIKYLELQAYNQPIDSIFIFNGVEYLILQSFNHPLGPGILPESIKYLKLPSFNHPLKEGSIPRSVIHLVFNKFNQFSLDEINLILPKFLDFGDAFDIEKYGILIPEDSILTLRTGFTFNQPINQRYIPSSVTDLQLYNYNLKILPHSIPRSIIMLTLGSNFTHFESLSNLPSSIINLTFGFKNNFKIAELKKYIPSHITSININGKIVNFKKSSPLNTFNQSTDNILNNNEHFKEDWEIISTLGSGNFGKVFKARKINGIINGSKVSLCAIKKIEKKDKLKIKLSTEVEILNKLKDNEHSMKYYGYGYDEDDNLFIYTEYIEGSTSISDLIKKKPNNRFEEEEIKSLMIKIVKALSKIHESGVIHRDIKSDHIILAQDKNNETIVKFIDFGLSKQIEKNSKYYSFVGTDSHMAPEVKLQNGKAGSKSDIFCIGCTMIEMAGLNLCHSERDDKGIPSIPTHLSNSFKNIIQNCLKFDTNARHSVESLIITLSNIQIEGDSVFEKYLSPNLKKLELKTNEPILLGSIGNEINYLSLPIYNQMITPGALPPSVQYLLFNKLNQYLECDSIPESVKYLDLGNEFDIEKNGINLSNESILVLRCGFNFTQPVSQRLLPYSVTDLQLYNYNINLKRNSIPTLVTSLTLGSNFTNIESLSFLPENVNSLAIGIKDEDEKLTKEIEKIIQTKKSITSFKINGIQRN